jgi:acyl carrier protein
VTEAEVYPKLTAILREVFDRDDIEATPTLAADQVEGWDSFKQVEILIAVQEEFSLKFSSRELDSLKNVGDLVSIVVAKTH